MLLARNAGVVKVGNRTECALLQLCNGLGGSYARLRSSHELVRRYPFSSDRKRMSSLTYNPGERCGLQTPSVPCHEICVGSADLVAVTVGLAFPAQNADMCCLVVLCSLDGLMCARLFVKGAAEMVLDLCTQQV